uniref:Transgelin n=1 Tax=Oncorhynchus kisutch TaxID=8019 RepID=A0A8C7N2I9_ONCKI
MANKGPSYGMSRVVQDKIDKKYDAEVEELLVQWIVAQCGSGVGKPEAGKLGFQDWLKDGCVLSELINSLHKDNKPIKKIASSNSIINTKPLTLVLSPPFSTTPCTALLPPSPSHCSYNRPNKLS